MSYIITPALTRALTTVEDVQRELGKTDAGAEIISHIKAASIAIEGTLRRTLSLQQYGENIYVASSRPLYLTHRPVRAIVIDGIAGIVGREVDAESGLLNLPAGAHTIVYWSGYDLPGTELGHDRPTGAPAADMRFHLPADIRRAATLLAASYHHAAGRDPFITREDVPGVGSWSFGTVGVGHNVDALLAPHRDIPVA